MDFEYSKGKKKNRNSSRRINTLNLLIILTLSLLVFALGTHIGLSDSETTGKALIRGYVWNDTLDEYAQNFTVEITGETFLGNSTITNEEGYYEIYVYAGELTLTIKKDGHIYKTHKFSVESGETKYIDFEITEKKEEEEGVFDWITLDRIISDIIEHWYILIFIIVLCIIAPILLSVIDRIFERVQTKNYKILDDKSINFIERIIRYNIYIAFIIFLLLLLALLFPGFDKTVWRYVAPHIPAIYTILIMLIILRLLLLILKRAMDYLRGELSVKPKLKLSPRYIGVLEIILKYLIILIFGINAIIITLAIFGMGDLIYNSFTGFLNENSGYLVFIILIVIIMYFAARFMGSFIGDMKRKETARISPQIADLVGKVGKIMVYIFGAMVIMFALLQMANMGDLGQTLILMISMIIGFVVAMAATGSIGNVLSGLMLNAFRPYTVGDRVKIGDEIGDVVGSNLAFVQLETLNSEIIEISNNTVIADKIINYSKSGAFAVVMDVSIGYNVPNEMVKTLMMEAARETKDLEDDPRPNVLLINLGDYAVTYRLRGYTTNAKAMMSVRSNLMANVHNKFYKHGVEILSPWYLVKREEAIPSSEKISKCWEETEKENKEVLEKEAGKKITDSFELMEKTLTLEAEKKK